MNKCSEMHYVIIKFWCSILLYLRIFICNWELISFLHIKCAYQFSTRWPTTKCGPHEQQIFVRFLYNIKWNVFPNGLIYVTICICELHIFVKSTQPSISFIFLLTFWFYCSLWRYRNLFWFSILKNWNEILNSVFTKWK